MWPEGAPTRRHTIAQHFPHSKQRNSTNEPFLKNVPMEKGQIYTHRSRQRGLINETDTKPLFIISIPLR